MNSDMPEDIGDDRPDNDAERDKALTSKMDGVLTDYPLECLWQLRKAGRKD